jgi:hypothetical protein
VTPVAGQNPAVTSAQPPRGRRAIIAGAVAAVVVALGVGLVIAVRDDGGTTHAGSPATSGPGGATGTNAATASTGAPSPSVGAATTPAVPAPVPTTAAVTVTMPDLVGKNAATARIELEKLGFGDVRFGAQGGGEDVVLPQNWTVSRQSTAAGARVPTSTAIVLTCTRRV